VLLIAKDIRKTYNSGKHNEFTALKEVSLEIEAGEFLCLRGPSGSGKTSLLSVIACLTRPTSGRITLHGEIISSLPEHFITQVRRKTFGFIFQKFNLIPGLTVLENIMIPAYPNGPKYAVLLRTANKLMDQLSIRELSQRRVEELSGGQAQRTAICRALINGPEVIIADEPTANLDSVLSQTVIEILGELQAQGKTVLMSSHDPLVYNSPLVSRVIQMHDGEIVNAT